MVAPPSTARIARPARAADDWCVALQGGCRCAPCGALRTFLADPARQVLEWKLAKDGRGHVHSRIDQVELPVRHLTWRTGSPHTLMLTKTQELFGREREARNETRRTWPGSARSGHWLTEVGQASRSAAKNI
jgi:hypothetical protein